MEQSHAHNFTMINIEPLTSKNNIYTDVKKPTMKSIETPKERESEVILPPELGDDD